MQQEDSATKVQSLAAVVKSLDDALKSHLHTMKLWYASQNIFPEISDALTSTAEGLLSEDGGGGTQADKPRRSSRDLSKASTTSSSQQQQASNTNNNNSLGIVNDSFNMAAQYGNGSRMRMRRNTKIPVGFDDSAISKFRRPSAAKSTVSVRVMFMKIGVIDTIHDRYSAEVLIQSKWRETAFDNKKQAGDSIDWDVYWNPRLSIENVIGEPKLNVSYTVNYDRDARATVVERRRINGQFFEFMELNEFPFDHQDLTVTVVSEHDVDRVDLVLDLEEKCGINAQAFSAEQEWSLEQNVSTWKRTIPRTINKTIIDFPALSVAAKASRRPQFFIWNIIVIMMAICSLAFATFTVNLETPQFRLQLTYILLLTTVTFKFVVNKSLPKISYLTYLDTYILGSMVILCGICVWHALIGSIIYQNLPKATSTRPSATGTTPTTSTTTLSPFNSFTDAATTAPIKFFENKSTTLCTGEEMITAPGEMCILIDKIALGTLSLIYVAFHLIFLALIIHSRRDEESGEEKEDQVTEEPPSSPPPQRNGVRISLDPATQASSLTSPSE